MTLLARLVAGLFAGMLFSAVACAQSTLRIGTTPVFLDDQIGFLARWGEYLSRRLGQPVQFVQRGSYRQIVEALKTQAVDFAWICGYPYVREDSTLRLVAVPVYQASRCTAPT